MDWFHLLSVLSQLTHEHVSVIIRTDAHAPAANAIPMCIAVRACFANMRLLFVRQT